MNSGIFVLLPHVSLKQSNFVLVRNRCHSRILHSLRMREKDVNVNIMYSGLVLFLQLPEILTKDVYPSCWA